MHINFNDDFASLSKEDLEDDSSTIGELLPVNLESQDFKEFKRHFHPRRSVGAPKHFVELALYNANLSVYLNAIVASLRDLFVNHEYWTQSGVDLGARVTQTIINLTKNVQVEPVVKKYILAMGSGNHIIRDSIRYPGGKDFLFVGARGFSKSPTLNIEPTTTLSSIPSYSGGYGDVSEKSKTEIGKAVLETAWAIQSLLFEDKNINNKTGSYARIISQHTIDKNLVAEILKVVIAGPLAKHGIAIQLPPFTGQLSQPAQNYLQKYVSTLTIREPNSDHVQVKYNSEDGIPDESLKVALENVALQPNIHFSFSLNVPQNFVEFISQTKDKQPPLMALHTWVSSWASSMMRPPGVKLGTAFPNRAPMYSMVPSKSAEITENRKKLGFYIEPGRSNEDGIHITENGDIAYLPPQSELDHTNCKQYEEILEENLRLSYEAGSPLTSQVGSAGKIFELASKDYKDKIGLVKGQLHKFAGSLQTYNWDLNCVLTVSNASPDRLTPTKLIGRAKPNELNLAEYIRAPFSVGFLNMFSRSAFYEGNIRRAPTKEDIESIGIVNSSIFRNLFKFYSQLVKIKKAPELQEIIDKAAKALEITSLTDEKVSAFELDRLNNARTIYGIIDVDLKLTVDVVPEKIPEVLNGIVSKVFRDARCEGFSNLAAYCIKNNMSPADTNRYFSPTESHTVHEFANIYNYLGGQILLQIEKAILQVPFKELSLAQDVGMDDQYLPFKVVTEEVIPFCVMFSKYITEKKDEILKKADELEELNKHPVVTEADLNIVGSKAPTADKPGMQLFPHQAEDLMVLKNHPKIAILDIDPGGGKTSILLADIAMTYGDGLIKRPFIICPNGLVGNWIEDLHKHMEGRWNIIPITTDTYRTWGNKKLTKMIKEAPPNTIVVVGSSFLSNKGKTQLILGNAVETVSDTLEFCKKFEPDYVAIDESHRLRNTTSNIHKLVKSLNQMSSVKFGRIGTGTFIQNVLSDCVGQVAVFNAQPFRTKDDFDNTYKKPIVDAGGNVILDYDAGTPRAIREHLSKFATVLSHKKKDWAFMLPLPVETFISVEFEDADAEGGRRHRMFYDAVLKRTLIELRNDKIIKALLKGKGAEEVDDDDADDEETVEDKEAGKSSSVTTPSGTKVDVADIEIEDDNLDALEAALQPYLQRLERILTDPFGDEGLKDVADAFFGSDFNRETFVTAKVRKTVSRIEKHFEPNEWKHGSDYKSSDMADFNGKRYIFRPEEPIGNTTLKTLKSPEEDTENWKPQSVGKVLVFCRYVRSVDSIYRALPKELQKRAVRFHGEEENKWENLNRFKNDPTVDILIANEQAISEGHNLQKATRFIRIEAPWAPGELDQSSSRVFRPDVAGETQRQIIFLDWIICNGTLEVAKLGRLISKMLKKTQFDELDNPKYYKNLNPLNLPIIKMSLDNIQYLSKMDDLCAIGGDGSTSNIHGHSYIGQYQYLVHETAAEFREMKRTRRATMVDVIPTPMPEGSAVIEHTPWIANIKIPDRLGEGLLSLNGVLQEEDHPVTIAFAKDKDSLLGQFVRTEFGLGTISKVSTRRGERNNELSKVWVDLVQGGTVENLSPSKVFLATKVTEQMKSKGSKNAPKITDEDKKRTEKARKIAEKAEERDAKRSTKFKKDLESSLKRRPKVVEEEVDEVEDTIHLNLYPVVYNQFLALEALPVEEDVDLDLKKFGFSQFNEYAWIPVKTYKNFNAILDYLEAKFTLSHKTERLLESLFDSFIEGKGRKFAVEVAPVAQLPLFYKTRHTLTVVKNPKKPDLKLYPVILNGSLMLVVDMATNPVFRRHVNKAIAGTTPVAKFQVADGLDIAFFSTKRDMIAKVKELRQGGYVVDNIDELKEEVNNLNLKLVSGK